MNWGSLASNGRALLLVSGLDQPRKDRPGGDPAQPARRDVAWKVVAEVDTRGADPSRDRKNQRRGFGIEGGQRRRGRKRRRGVAGGERVVCGPDPHDQDVASDEWPLTSEH